MSIGWPWTALPCYIHSMVWKCVLSLLVCRLKIMTKLNFSKMLPFVYMYMTQCINWHSMSPVSTTALKATITKAPELQHSL